MGRIDDLIQQYCPEGVQMVQLGKVASISRGVRVVKAELTTEGKFPVYQNSLKPLGYLDKSNTCANTTFVISAGAAGEIGFSNTDFWAADDCLKIDCGKFLLPKLVFHYLLNIQPSIKRHVRKASVPRLSRAIIEKIEIPLPPLPVQEAIVEILDKFDRLSAELQAELQARKQQYEYYRNQLLTRFAPEQPVTEYSLGELGTITRGNGLQKKDFTESGVGCIHYGQIYTRYKTFTEKTLTYVDESLAKKLLHVEKGDLVIACTSENVEDVCKCVAWLGEDTIVTGGHACVYRHNQNPKYMAYFFQTDYFFQQKKKYAYGAKVIDIKPDSIAKITIPLPSLEEQARIVAILDKFEALVNDLSQGLPAEIAAVQEQYEYYRNKLLTFKTKE